MKNVDNIFSFEWCIPDIKKFFKKYFEKEENQFVDETIDILFIGVKNINEAFYIPYLNEIKKSNPNKNINYEIIINEDNFFEVETQDYKKVKLDRISDVDAVINQKYNIICCCLQLHYCMNWRVSLLNILRYLKDGGDLMYAEVCGDFEILDGNFKFFKRKLIDNNSHLFEQLMYSVFKVKSKLFFWKPEISMSNSLILTQRLDNFFGDIIHSEPLWSKSSNYGNKMKQMYPIKIRISEFIKNILGVETQNNYLTSYLRTGLPIELAKREQFLENVLEYQGLKFGKRFSKEKLLDFNSVYKIDKGCKIFIAKKFNLNKFNNYASLNQMSLFGNSLAVNLQKIGDNDIEELGRKALQIFSKHDIFIPELTLYCAIISWQEGSANWINPMYLLENNLDEDLIYRKFNKVINLEKKFQISPFGFIFKKFTQKFPITIKSINSEEMNKFLNIEKEHDISETSYYEKKRNTKIGLNLMVHDGNQSTWFSYDYLLNEENKIKKIIIYISDKFRIEGGEYIQDEDNVKIDSTTSISGGLRLRSLSRKNVENILERTKNENQIPFELNEINSSNSKNNNENKEKYKWNSLANLLDLNKSEFYDFLLVLEMMRVFQLSKKGYQLSFFTSSILESEYKLETSSTGLGGIILFEKDDHNIKELFEKNNNEIIKEDRYNFEKQIKSLINDRNRTITNINNLIFYKASIASYVNHDFRNHALKAAISYISSRNGSHGIGSHVLPAVSHFQTTSIDEKYLFEYLQQRLDFITQASADFPEWTYPAWFARDLMQRFYSQFYLIENLAQSEGLSAYKYEPKQSINLQDKIIIQIRKKQFARLNATKTGWEKSTDTSSCKNYDEIIDICKKEHIEYYLANNDSSKSTIIYGMIKSIDSESTITILSYAKINVIINVNLTTLKIEAGDRLILEGKIKKNDDDDNNFTIVDTTIKEKVEYSIIVSNTGGDLRKDCQVSIPSGVVGFQAFYTILENIIRNAAKHNWTKIKERRKKESDLFELNLIINIELEDRSSKNDYICKIWTNATDLRFKDGIVSDIEKDKYYSDNELLCIINSIKTPEEILNTNNIEYDRSKIIKILPKKINEYLKSPIIDGEGQMNRDQLGVTEIKISAGFLSKQPISYIGGVEGKSIILGNLRDNQQGFIRASVIWEKKNRELIPRLGYRFILLKPKEVIIISDRKFEMNENSIEYFSYNDLSKKQEDNKNNRKIFELDYEFCVFIIDRNDFFEIEILRHIFSFLIYSICDDFLKSKYFQDENEFGKRACETNEFLMEEIEHYPFRLFIVLEEEHLLSFVSSCIESVFFEGEENVKAELIEKAKFGLSEFIKWIDSKGTATLINQLEGYLKFLRQRIVFISKGYFDENLDINHIKEPKKLRLNKFEIFKLRLYDRWIKLFELKSNYSYILSVKIDSSNENGKSLYLPYIERFLSDGFLFAETVWKVINQKDFHRIGKDENAEQQNKSIMDCVFKGNLIQEFRKINIKYKDEETPTQIITLIEYFVEKIFKKAKLSSEQERKISMSFKNIIETTIDKSFVSTLPKSYREKIRNRNNSSEIYNVEISRKNFSFLNNNHNENIAEDDKSKVMKIAYHRHETVQKSGNNNLLYSDLLSGKKNSFSIFKDLFKNGKNVVNDNEYLKWKFRLSLFENAYPIVMIIDERVWQFVDFLTNNQTFEDLNIIIPTSCKKGIGDDLKPILLRNNNDPKDFHNITFQVDDNQHIEISFKQPLNTFHPKSPGKIRVTTLVIHQTILERLCDFDLEKMDKLILKIKERIPSVVVTSGRGKPSKTRISKYVKYIPFSNIKTFLMQEFPDRYLFMQAIFKTLN